MRVPRRGKNREQQDRFFLRCVSSPSLGSGRAVCCKSFGCSWLYSPKRWGGVQAELCLRAFLFRNCPRG